MSGQEQSCLAVNPIIQHVVIEKVANGFIVRVGCKTFVATLWFDVATSLDEYFKDPVAAQKKYCGESK